MKKILFFLMLSKTVWVLEYSEKSNAWFDFCPSKAQVVSVIMLSLFNGQALADNVTNASSLNCTNPSYPPYTLTDPEAEAMAWWQVSTGIFAVAMIFNNFIAPGFFYIRAENDRAEILQSHIDYITRDNDRLMQNADDAEKILAIIREKWGRTL